MAKINISLVGGQTYPVYLGIAESKPDKVVLVHSETSKGEAERIAKETNVPTEYKPFDPVDVTKVFAQARNLVKSISADDQYVINITSGTKVWTIVFYEVFKGLENVEFIYIDQNNNMYNLTTNKVEHVKSQLNTELVLKLNGTHIVSSTKFREYTPDDIRAIDVIKEMRNFDYGEFNELTIPNDRTKKDQFEATDIGMFETWNESSVRWDKTHHKVELVINDKHGKCKKKTISSPHALHITFFSGWFELYVANMLSSWKYAKEIIMNVKFPYKNNNPKNEIDIIVNTGNRLLFVECKTQIYDITDLDKFRTAVKNYGGMGCKSLFITEGSMKDTAAEKCEDSNILCFSVKDCGNLLSVQDALFIKLEQELFEINKK
jgi:hypothetical protein